ncbi:hypothetical protein MTO96_036415 [Rhipicephalus appendiculatus]
MTECDPEILFPLQRNEIALSWAATQILRHEMTAEGTALADLLDVCDARFDIYERVGDFTPRTLDHRIRMALMSTRSAYYALRTKYPPTASPRCCGRCSETLTGLR